ncbi:ABC transporter substrate-binding protein [Candidatus Latescibacterota bacterium]
MKRWIITVLPVLLIVLALVFSLKTERPQQSVDRVVGDGRVYNRIVSLSPGITETLFALGVGDRVVGVTRFCLFPLEAQEKAEVGGFVDPNYEAIVALEPDLVLVLEIHGDVVRYLDELEINYATVRNEGVSDILASIITVGRVCGIEPRSREIVDDIERRMRIIGEKTRDTESPDVLISVSRQAGTGSLGDVYVAGRETFFNELIEIAGGVNAYHGRTIDYPVISAEGLLVLNPDIIIDIIPHLKSQQLDVDTVRKDWKSIPGLRAAKNGTVHVVDSRYAVIPGPRFILFLEDLTKIIHPGLFGETL